MEGKLTFGRPLTNFPLMKERTTTPLINVTKNRRGDIEVDLRKPDHYCFWTDSPFYSYVVLVLQSINLVINLGFR